MNEANHWLMLILFYQKCLTPYSTVISFSWLFESKLGYILEGMRSTSEENLLYFLKEKGGAIKQKFDPFPVVEKKKKENSIDLLLSRIQSDLPFAIIECKYN